MSKSWRSSDIIIIVSVNTGWAKIGLTNTSNIGDDSWMVCYTTVYVSKDDKVKSYYNNRRSRSCVFCMNIGKVWYFYCVCPIVSFPSLVCLELMYLYDSDGIICSSVLISSFFLQFLFPDYVRHV